MNGPTARVKRFMQPSRPRNTGAPILLYNTPIDSSILLTSSTLNDVSHYYRFGLSDVGLKFAITVLCSALFNT